MIREQALLSHLHSQSGMCIPPFPLLPAALLLPGRSSEPWEYLSYLIPFLGTPLVGGPVPNAWNAGRVTADHRLPGYQHSWDNLYPFRQRLMKMDEYLAKLFFLPTFDFVCFHLFFITVFYYKVVIYYTIVSQFLLGRFDLSLYQTLTEKTG